MIITSLKNYNSIKEISLSGRYITLNNIEGLILAYKDFFDFNILGHSELNAPIYNLTIGSGSIKVLMWSQMHGNESTTTKAVFDLLNYLKTNSEAIKSLLKKLTISIIPMLNPDGAKTYTRLNANAIDLNRDAERLSQKESVIFNKYINDFKPDICFNLHGQRTIFSAGKTNYPATLSFLSPAYNDDREVNDVRKQSMRLIAAVNDKLQDYIPNQIGRYDDGFNKNCLGDKLTTLNIPTILFEAGHYKNDYDREEVRYYIWIAMVEMLFAVKNNIHQVYDYEAYFDIPENDKLFCDVLIKNAKINNKICDIEILFVEILSDKKVIFMPRVVNISKSSKKFAHKYINANNNIVLAYDTNELKIGYENDIVLINNKDYSIK